MQIQPENQPRKSFNLSQLGLILYCLGALGGLIIAGLTAWPDQEASLFEIGIVPEEPLRTLNCPMWINKDETGLVTMVYHNTIDRPAAPLVRTHISAGHLSLVTRYDARWEIQPGEKRTYSWEITAGEGAFYNRIVLVRVYTYQALALPSRGGTCGVLVVDIEGIKGQTLVDFLVGASLISAVLGLFLFSRKATEAREKNLRNAMIALMVVISLALIFSIVGNWLLGYLLVVMGLLLGTVILGQQIITSH